MRARHALLVGGTVVLIALQTSARAPVQDERSVSNYHRVSEPTYVAPAPSFGPRSFPARIRLMPTSSAPLPQADDVDNVEDLEQ